MPDVPDNPGLRISLKGIHFNVEVQMKDVEF
jgi:hypothetical protein